MEFKDLRNVQRYNFLKKDKFQRQQFETSLNADKGEANIDLLSNPTGRRGRSPQSAGARRRRRSSEGRARHIVTKPTTLSLKQVLTTSLPKQPLSHGLFLKKLTLQATHL